MVDGSWRDNRRRIACDRFADAVESAINRLRERIELLLDAIDALFEVGHLRSHGKPTIVMPRIKQP